MLPAARARSRRRTLAPSTTEGSESYWRRAFDIEFLVDECVIDAEDRKLFWFAETAMEIWDGILHWHDVCPPAWAEVL